MKTPPQEPTPKLTRKERLALDEALVACDALSEAAKKASLALKSVGGLAFARIKRACTKT